MIHKPRAVRFSDEEEAQIQKFLELNSFLDFSTLARVAIKQFMENPKLDLRPLGKHTKISKEQKHPNKETAILTPITGVNELNSYNQ